MRNARRYAIAMIMALGLNASCNQIVLPGSNPFTDLTPLNFNSLRQKIVSEISPLGTFDVGTVLSIRGKTFMAYGLLPSFLGREHAGDGSVQLCF